MSAQVRRQFGDLIRHLRAQAGITQDELARRSGLHRTYVADIERGARNPSLLSIDKLARGLQLSVAGLFRSAPPDEPGQGGPERAGR